MPRPYLIVLRQLGGIGDMLMLSPLAQALKDAHPGHEVWLVTDSSYMGGALVEIAKRGDWDRIVDVPIHLATTVETAEAQGIPFEGDVAGHPLVLKAAALLDLNNVCAIAENSMPDPPHRLDVWAHFAGVRVGDPRPVYRVHKSERRWAQAWLDRKRAFASRAGLYDGPVVGLAPIAVDPARRLPSGSARAIMDRLEAADYLPILLDRDASVDGHLDANGLTFVQTAAVVSLLDAVVAVDSGLLHVAGALGRPLVGLFGSIPAERRMAFYRGRALQANVPCAPCWYRQGCRRDPDPANHFACMRGFDADRVVQEVGLAIDGNSGATPGVE